jgi:hypothetical protein
MVLYTFMGYCRIVYDGMGKKETKEKLTRVEGVIRLAFFSPILLFLKFLLRDSLYYIHLSS